MSAPSVRAVQQYLRWLGDEAVVPDDAELLRRFVADQDREAFERLITRHGPMVLGTARRLVEDSHDAEDVFQAVFLSLARLAKTICQGRTLPAWLHKTTCRVAAKVRKNRAPRSNGPSPEQCALNDPGADLVWREVRQALDEELQRLPDRWRSPLLLCYLSGLTRNEAAKQLGWSLGTLKRRLEEGRDVLRRRLERRGVGGVGLALAVLTPEALHAGVSSSLFAVTVSLVFSAEAFVPATISALLLGSATALKGLAMKAILAILAFIGVGVGLYPRTGQADPPKQTEREKPDGLPAPEDKVVQGNDPMPAGSTLRFGTSRFRHGTPIVNMAVSADGKIAVTVNGTHWLGSSRVFDLASGRALYPIEGVGTHIETAAISPDGRTIVTKQDAGGVSLHVRDAGTGQELRKIALPPANPRSANECLVFTPDGKGIAATSEGKVVHLIDFESGKPIRDFPCNRVVYAIAFSPDGKRMASGGYDHDKWNYMARLWDVDTGQELRRLMHGTEGGIRALAFSPDGKTLASGGDDARLRLWDVATGKEEIAFPKDGYRIRSVAWAPDGKTVAAAGDSIRLYDAAARQERRRIDRQAIGLRFTDGGRTLTGAVKGAIYRWDAATGKALTPESAGDSIVEQILVTPDGRRVVTRGQDGDAHLWDGTNGNHLRAFPAAWQRGMAMSPDGRFLAWAVADPSVKFINQLTRNEYEGARLRLYDLAAGTFENRFPGFPGDAQDVTFTGDGKSLLTVDHGDGVVRRWNVASGKEEQRFQAVPENENNQSHHVWRTALSPDGTTLAVAYDEVEGGGRRGFGAGSHLVRLWDVAGGKERHRLEGHHNYVLDIAFSPDGRYLVTAGEKTPIFDPEVQKKVGQVFVWDVATGSRAAGVSDGLPIGASAVAFSRDGRFLATALPEGAVQLWEVATWTLRNEFPGHRDRPTALTFAPDGQLLSGSLDTTVLAWDTRPPRVAATGSLETAWVDLAKGESREALSAEGRFVANPAEAVKFFAEKIKPVKAPDATRMRRLIADLDSADFTVRDAASKALGDPGRQAKPYLEEAVKTTKSAEVLARARKVLEGLKKVTPEQLRHRRAVYLLEMIGNEDARALLKDWAAGFKGASLTEEATAAVKRLEGVVKALAP